jgi:ribosome-binding protein aMBF1 (putative translation factor)
MIKSGFQTANTAVAAVKTGAIGTVTADLETKFASMSPAAKRALADAIAVGSAADLVRICRQSASLSQTALGDRIDAKQSQISEMENRTGPQGPTFATVKRIVDACGYEMEIRLRPRAQGRQAPMPVRIEIMPK